MMRISSIYWTAHNVFSNKHVPKLQHTFQLGLDDSGHGGLESGVVVEGHFVALVIVAVVLIEIVTVRSTCKSTVQHLRIGIRVVQGAVVARGWSVRTGPGTGIND